MAPARAQGPARPRGRSRNTQSLIQATVGEVVEDAHNWRTTDCAVSYDGKYYAECSRSTDPPVVHSLDWSRVKTFSGPSSRGPPAPRTHSLAHTICGIWVPRSSNSQPQRRGIVFKTIQGSLRAYEFDNECRVGSVLWSFQHPKFGTSGGCVVAGDTVACTFFRKNEPDGSELFVFKVDTGTMQCTPLRKPFHRMYPCAVSESGAVVAISWEMSETVYGVQAINLLSREKLFDLAEACGAAIDQTGARIGAVTHGGIAFADVLSDDPRSVLARSQNYTWLQDERPTCDLHCMLNQEQMKTSKHSIVHRFLRVDVTGRKAIVAGGDEDVTVWDLNDGKRVAKLEDTRHALSVQMDGEGNFAAVVLASGTLRFFKFRYLEWSFPNAAPTYPLPPQAPEGLSKHRELCSLEGDDTDEESGNVGTGSHASSTSRGAHEDSVANGSHATPPASRSDDNQNSAANGQASGTPSQPEANGQRGRGTTGHARGLNASRGRRPRRRQGRGAARGGGRTDGSRETSGSAAETNRPAVELPTRHGGRTTASGQNEGPNGRRLYGDVPITRRVVQNAIWSERPSRTSVSNDTTLSDVVEWYSKLVKNTTDTSEGLPIVSAIEFVSDLLRAIAVPQHTRCTDDRLGGLHMESWPPSSVDVEKALEEGGGNEEVAATLGMVVNAFSVLGARYLGEAGWRDPMLSLPWRLALQRASCARKLEELPKEYVTDHFLDCESNDAVVVTPRQAARIALRLWPYERMRPSFDRMWKEMQSCTHGHPFIGTKGISQALQSVSIEMIMIVPDGSSGLA